MMRVGIKRTNVGTRRWLQQRHEWLSSSSSSPSSSIGEHLRVAIVGGGAAGLSCALHLAPLVEAGMIASPIDVYDTSSAPQQQPQLPGVAVQPEMLPFSTRSGASGREIGVGIWSTALDPFRDSDRESHRLVFKEMTTRGTWVGDVGYRVAPSGAWLMKSHLPVNQQEADASGMPSLLFIREKDMLQSLQKAVHWEELHGMIRVHSDGNNKTRVTGLYQESSLPWSTQLVLNDGGDSSSSSSSDNNNNSSYMSERDYHLIIACDGIHSTIRRDYGGHDTIRRILTGTSALPSPIELPHSHSSNSKAYQSASWGEEQRKESVGLQDRNYTVFRGNSKLTKEEMGVGGVSFQTWGLGKSMRFATVPMLYPASALDKREERQVWFITTDVDAIAAERDPTKRRAMLLEEFKDWHDPISRIVEATPPEEILVERAVAHRHCMGPVLSFNKIVQQIKGVRPPNSGMGPCVIFVGDACMTVDPILAQGFTVAMEGAAVLRRTVEQSCIPCAQDPSLAFDPYELRKQLQIRHDTRMDRLVCLLRATELVQALGQPTGGLGGFFNTKLLRPLVRLVPNFIKRPIFDSVLKYSLGLSPFSSAKPVGTGDTSDSTTTTK